MKKLSLLLAVFIVITESTAQMHKTTMFDKTVVERLDPGYEYQGFNSNSLVIKDSLPDGSYFIYTDTTLKNLVCKGTFKNRKKTGEWIYYHGNGQKSEQFYYKEGKLSGKYKSFTYAGMPCQTVTMVNGFKDGPMYTYNTDYWMFYDFERGQTGVKNYKNGAYDGKQTGYNMDSNIITYITYSDKKKISDVSIKYGDTIETKIGYRATRPEPPAGTQFELGLYVDSKPNPKKVPLEDKLNLLKDLKKIHKLNITLAAAHPKENDLIIEAINALPASTKIYELSISIDTGLIVPVSFFKFKTIQKLYLSNFDKTPAALSLLKDLTFLQIKTLTKQTSVLTTDIVKLPKLKTVYMHYYEPSKSDMDLLKKIPSLKYLVIDDSYQDSIPDIFYGLTQLKALFLGGYGSCTKFTPITMPPSLFSLKSLHGLEVCWHRVSEEQKALLSKKMPLCKRVIYETCFDGSTQVNTTDNSMLSLVDFITGEQIKAYDTITGKLSNASVIKVHRHDISNAEMLCMYYTTAHGTDSIITTPNHLFMGIHHKWQMAATLLKGDKLIYFSKESDIPLTATITEIKKVTFTSTEVFNLKTSLSTYIANGLVVHNK